MHVPRPAGTLDIRWGEHSEDLPVLGYWDMRCLAEPIRLLLHHAGVSFLDRRYEAGPPPEYPTGLRIRLLLVSVHLPSTLKARAL